MKMCLFIINNMMKKKNLY